MDTLGLTIHIDEEVGKIRKQVDSLADDLYAKLEEAKNNEILSAISKLNARLDVIESKLGDDNDDGED